MAIKLANSRVMRVPAPTSRTSRVTGSSIHLGGLVPAMSIPSRNATALTMAWAISMACHLAILIVISTVLEFLRVLSARLSLNARLVDCLSLQGRESHSLSYMFILLSFSLDLLPLYPPCGANRAWWHALVFYCE
ncbi:hypothetical protein ASPVEDRAFT_871101, partial [Aspergillus versicolor CBS 583.65]